MAVQQSFQFVTTPITPPHPKYPGSSAPFRLERETNPKSSTGYTPHMGHGGLTGISTYSSELAAQQQGQLNSTVPGAAAIKSNISAPAPQPDKALPPPSRGYFGHDRQGDKTPKPMGR
jgi:hypothetical protein